MKLLRNPWVTAALVVAAVVIIFLQIPGMHLNLFRARQSSPPPAAPAKSTAAVAINNHPGRPKTSVPAEAAPASPMDRQYVASQFASWVDSPLRDPFLLLDSGRNNQLTDTETNSPVTTWKLTGIWRQTGTQLAVINNHVYQEGDEVAPGYTLEKIAGDEVWFQGPDRKERLGFRELGRIEETGITNRASPPNQPRATQPAREGPP